MRRLRAWLCLCSFVTLSLVLRADDASVFLCKFKHDSQSEYSCESTLPLNWNASLTKYLPVDTSTDPKVRQVYGACLSFVDPTPIKYPILISYSRDAAALLDVDLDLEGDHQSRDDFVSYFSGNHLIPNAPKPFAHCYGGHQFGYWSGQLGDGRAITLGEVTNKHGERWEISLKGAGKTPYSRSGDGRAVLRSSIREFLCSEYMHAIGVPTTRALSLIGSETEVFRDQFYDGHLKAENCAVVARLSPSFMRFGSFEIFFHRKEYEHIKTLADYVIDIHFPHILSHERQLCQQQRQQSQQQQNAESLAETTELPACDRKEAGTNSYRYRAWFRGVVERTAKLIAKWQSIGFAHGVLNTDNMSILGLTIDYGPFGFLEEYDPHFVPNTSDDEGRYAFDQQPEIGRWNLEKLGSALAPVLTKKPMMKILKTYFATYYKHYHLLMTQKVGLLPHPSDSAGEAIDKVLIADLLDVMESTRSDFTNTFYAFSSIPRVNDSIETRRDFVRVHLMKGRAEERDVDKWLDWLDRYSSRLEEDGDEDNRIERMMRTNPKYVLRNHLAHRAIEMAEDRDYTEVNTLLRVLSSPFAEDRLSFAEQQEDDVYALPYPSSASPIRVSCSS